MIILVLAVDAKERSAIEHILRRHNHDVFAADGLDAAVQIVSTEHPRLAIVDEDIGGDQRTEFIGRVRSASRDHVHILSLLTAINTPLDSDDAMRKPFTAAELVSRVSLAQRYLSLGDSLAEARVQIDEMAMYDPLTGLMNHGAFARTAQGELERARRAGSPLSIICLNLDNSKDLNSGYGSAAADAALRAIGNTVRERSRPYDCIGRWASDEFMVVLPGVIGDDAERIAERIIKGMVSSEILFDAQPLPVLISAGIATIIQMHATTDLPFLINQARQAGVRARESGGNRVFLTFA